jgi:hypothetical protein
MLCLWFGDIVEYERPFVGKDGRLSRDGKGELILEKEPTGENVLHISCAYRVGRDCEIILTENDYYVPSTEIQEKADAEGRAVDFDEDRIGKLGNNRIDEIMESRFKNLEGFVVKSVAINAFGDLRIQFTNGYSIDAFIDTSDVDECWRFFHPTQEDDLVVTGKGIQQDDEI